MKKTITWILAICILLSMAACGKTEPATHITFPTASPTTQEQTDGTTAPADTTVPTATQGSTGEATWLQLYRDVIADYATVIDYRLSDGFDVNTLPQFSSTLENTISDLGNLDYRWDCMLIELPTAETGYGYILHDLNGDGTPELFWVRTDHSIVAIFTCYEEKVVLLDAFWSRYHCVIGENNALYTHGSSGAADNTHSILILNKDTLEEAFTFQSETNTQGGVDFYEVTPAVEIMIGQERYDALMQMFPYEQSSFWLSLPISDLEDIPRYVDRTSDTQLPYLQKVTRDDQSILDGPGYDFGFVDTVQTAGTFTIVAEVTDSEGFLWGKLKSGAGWIELTQVRQEQTQKPILTANFADSRLLDSGNYHHYVADSSQFSVTIAFRAHEALTEVSFFSVLVPGDMSQTQELYHLDRLDPEKPFVAEVSFPGDLSMYGIRVTDSKGVTHTYTVTISGRNGALVMFEQ